ncbi:DUF4329 domain-containing protein [Xenorhabdus sp. XENO-10]|uniref:DUF4329 domain-containing protein n=1 Tax=Xenorhabdus yunnanensis TaxID=3025878 RepID=A0ABT5LN29_9GAMM|nr:DUF4329 domain-containing protein [Xenorhabdus yunnanensis]MDC9591254.1 DUF4329 domain-containing protein [Xenorhabdus yunnanensis]
MKKVLLILLAFLAVIYSVGSYAGLRGCEKRHYVTCFRTLDDAARTALKIYNKQSINRNKEYGGIIFRDKNGRYGYIRAYVGNNRKQQKSTITKAIFKETAKKCQNSRSISHSRGLF